jgi:hypothetical protein
LAEDVRWNDTRIVDFLAVLMGKDPAQITEVNVAEFSFSVSSITNVETTSNREFATRLRRAAHTILQRQGDPTLQKIEENEEKISGMKLRLSLAIRVMFIVECVRKEKVSAQKAVEEIKTLASRAKEGLPELRFEAFLSPSGVETRPDAEKMYERIMPEIEPLSKVTSAMYEASTRKENEFAQSVVDLATKLVARFSERYRANARSLGVLPPTAQSTPEECAELKKKLVARKVDTSDPFVRNARAEGAGLPPLVYKNDLKQWFRRIKLPEDAESLPEFEKTGDMLQACALRPELGWKKEDPQVVVRKVALTEEDLIQAAKYSEGTDALFDTPKSIIFVDFWNEYEQRRGRRKKF